MDGGQETDGQGGPRTYSGPILDGKLVGKQLKVLTMQEGRQKFRSSLEIAVQKSVVAL